MSKSRRNKLTSTDGAVAVEGQPKTLCQDCPFARSALPGWLGGYTAEAYRAIAHSEQVVNCHARTSPEGPQCVGRAIYQANVCHSPRSKELLRMPADRELVFATPMEFLAHHAAAKGDDE